MPPRPPRPHVRMRLLSSPQQLYPHLQVNFMPYERPSELLDFTQARSKTQEWREIAKVCQVRLMTAKSVGRTPTYRASSFQSYHTFINYYSVQYTFCSGCSIQNLRSSIKAHQRHQCRGIDHRWTIGSLHHFNLSLHQLYKLDGSPKYQAFSYTWGSPRTDCTMQCNSESLDITTSLKNSLHQVRRPKAAIHVWADAICINQSDLHERKMQRKFQFVLEERQTTRLKNCMYYERYSGRKLSHTRTPNHMRRIEITYLFPIGSFHNLVRCRIRTGLQKWVFLLCL